MTTKAKLLEKIQLSSNASSVALFISELNKSDTGLDELKSALLSILFNDKELNINEAYRDDLEDLCAAMEGHCCSSYTLHPSNMNK
ncbi:TPA: hypothetical protein I7730_15720 [Vibrio vulnificus]|uniref:Uncharacterized protein n=1 Tax=Vibrio vulnificus TaxID=672 RepID=A0A8H9N1S3_VIBVL|nr:hypothetical protein [Vibrio vulnificus]